MRIWPECGMEAGTREARRAMRRLTAWSLGFCVLAAVGMVAISRYLRAHEDLPTWGRAFLTLLPALPFVAMFVPLVRKNRYLDELAVRVQFEALSMTVVVTIIGAFVWGQLQEAGLAPPTELSMAWPVMVFVYALCLWLARRRYQ